MLVVELLTTELLAAASEKVVGDDLHGTLLPTFGEFLRTGPWVGMGTAVLYYALLDRERARTRDEPAVAGSS